MLSARFISDLSCALDGLRVLTGPVCESCWLCDGEVVPATVLEHYHGWGAPEWFCERCHDCACERSWESHCADYYGGSGPVTVQERYEASFRDGK